MVTTYGRSACANVHEAWTASDISYHSKSKARGTKRSNEQEREGEADRRKRIADVNVTRP